MEQWKDKCLSRMNTILLKVVVEHYKQIKKWGVQTLPPSEWMMFLTEEVGELAQAISENIYRNGTKNEIFKEAIQVATLALKIAEMSDGDIDGNI